MHLSEILLASTPPKKDVLKVPCGGVMSTEKKKRRAVKKNGTPALTKVKLK